jgi:putative flavoprotein involved in K+ transport
MNSFPAMDGLSGPFDAVVIGAGQAGLASGYHLARTGLRYAILDGRQHVGDIWRERWDSLKLFTPAQHDSLPGLPFPETRNTFPSRDTFAGYLEDYARHFSLPVQTGVQVAAVKRIDNHAEAPFEVTTTAGTLRARSVVAAPGAHGRPQIPRLAADLDPAIRQLHSSQYLSPGSLPDGDVLVVGAGTSGAEIALELSATHRTFIAGRPTPHVPGPVIRYAGEAYWRLVDSVLTLDTPPGRKVAANFHRRGAPLIRISMRDLDRAGVTRLPRLAAVSQGKPLFDDATAADVRTVIWATGYQPAVEWIEGVPLTEWGQPITQRGVVPEVPGLYFVGMPFQYALTSGLIGGVGRDAEFVVEHLTRAVRAPEPSNH